MKNMRMMSMRNRTSMITSITYMPTSSGSPKQAKKAAQRVEIKAQIIKMKAQIWIGLLSGLSTSISHVSASYFLTSVRIISDPSNIACCYE